MPTQHKTHYQHFLLLLTILFFTLPLTAQETLRGRLLDAKSGEPIAKAAVSLLSTDSTFIRGSLSTDSGSFSLPADKGDYIVRMSCLGYKNEYRRISVGKTKTDLGTMRLVQDAITLGETVITAQLPPMTVKADTFIYNADAFKVPEGSTLEELVKRLPGAKIDDDGTITINGRKVSRVLLDNREFVRGNTSVAMKNIPTYIVDKVKAYDKKSDRSRLTGIDDGNEETVLDFSVKKRFRKGLFANNTSAIGTHGRWQENFFGSRLYGKMRYNIMGGGNNTANQGHNIGKNIGATMSYEERNKLKADASVRWNHNNSDNLSRTSAENFVNRRGAFSNRINHSNGRNGNLNLSGNLEWHPDTVSALFFRQSLSGSYSDGLNNNRSATFNQDPYLTTDDPLSKQSLEQSAADSITVNARSNKSNSYSRNRSLSSSFDYHRRLSNRGRNFSIGANFGWNSTESKNLSASLVHLYQLKDSQGNDSTYQTNRFSRSPSHGLNYSFRASYTEPLWAHIFAQADYSYSYSHSKQSPHTYDFDDLTEQEYESVLNGYRGWDAYFDLLNFPLDHYYDSELSRYSERTVRGHNINLQLRYAGKTINATAGLNIRPQRTHFLQDYLGVSVDTVRNICNITPTLNLRYRYRSAEGNQRNAHITYRGNSTEPSITNLLDITDNTNPLNIRKGNPGLKPSFSHNLGLDFSDFRRHLNRTLAGHLNFSTTSNSISTMVTYNERTGGSTTRPENINGNWSIGGGAWYNLSLDTLGTWNIGTNTGLSYSQHVGYIRLSKKKQSEKNYVRTTELSEGLNLRFHKDWIDLSLNGNFNYQHARNQLQPKSNLDTWRFSYGMNAQVEAPWGTMLSTDLRMHSRRGFNDASMNTNELIWNAQISQALLKGRRLVVMLRFNDILAQQSNFSRNINATSRTDTWTNGITSYALLRVTYRMNLFGNRQARRDMRNSMRQDGPSDNGRPAPPMPGDRRPGGGMDGNRPPHRGFGG